MDETRMDVFFRGKVASGHRPADVKERLKALFKVDDERIDQLFSGRPVAIRRNLDVDAARRYQEALAKAGALVELRATDSADAASPSQSVPPVSSSLPQPVAQPVQDATETAAATPGWTLTPVGADLLQPEERSAVTAAVVDIGALQIEPAGVELLKPEERKPVVVAAIDTSGLSLDSTVD
jgi:hypothetical protein